MSESEWLAFTVDDSEGILQNSVWLMQVNIMIDSHMVNWKGGHFIYQEGDYFEEIPSKWNGDYSWNIVEVSFS